MGVLDPSSGQKQIKHQGTGGLGGASPRSVSFRWPMQPGRSSARFPPSQEVRALFLLRDTCPTPRFQRDGTGRGLGTVCLDWPGGRTAGSSKQDVLLTAVLRRSSSTAARSHLRPRSAAARGPLAREPQKARGPACAPLQRRPVTFPGCATSPTLLYAAVLDVTHALLHQCFTRPAVTGDTLTFPVRAGSQRQANVHVHIDTLIDMQFF